MNLSKFLFTFKSPDDCRCNCNDFETYFNIEIYYRPFIFVITLLLLFIKYRLLARVACYCDRSKIISFITLKNIACNSWMESLNYLLTMRYVFCWQTNAQILFAVPASYWTASEKAHDILCKKNKKKVFLTIQYSTGLICLPMRN